MKVWKIVVLFKSMIFQGVVLGSHQWSIQIATRYLMSAFLLFLIPSTLVAGEAVPDIEETHYRSNYRKEPHSRQGLSV